MDFLFKLPGLGAGFFFSAAFAAFSLLGLWLTRPLFKRWLHKVDSQNDIVGMVIACFSVLYGIMLGLVAVGIYSDYSAISDLSTRESASLSAVYNDAGALSPQYRGPLQADLRAYLRATIDQDWPDQAKGVVPLAGTRKFQLVLNDLASIKPTERTDIIAFAQIFNQLDKIIEMRHERLLQVDNGIPLLIWQFVLLGCFINIVLIWMMDMERHIHFIMTFLFSFFLGAVIFLLADMDRPYRGGVFVSPSPYELVYDTITKVS
jgi:hypothetical protein